MKKTREDFKFRIICIVKAIVVTFVLLLAAEIVLGLTVYSGKDGSEWGEWPIYLLMTVLSPIAFYLLYVKPIADELHILGVKSDDSEAVGLKAELLAWVKGDGKLLIIIFAGLAVVYELAVPIYPLIFPDEPGNAVTLFLTPIFPFAGLIPIPIVGTVVSGAYLLGTIFAMSRVYKGK